MKKHTTNVDKCPKVHFVFFIVGKFLLCAQVLKQTINKLLSVRLLFVVLQNVELMKISLNQMIHAVTKFGFASGVSETFAEVLECVKFEPKTCNYNLNNKIK